MSRADDFLEMLDGYDEIFQHSWKDFLNGFEDKYCSMLNKLDDATKERLVNAYVLLKEVPDKEPMASYCDSIKKMLDKNTEPYSMKLYIDSVETLVRSFKR